MTQHDTQQTDSADSTAAILQDEIRDTLEELLNDGHDIQDVFDALDSVYDEFDQRACEDALVEVPVFEAEVIGPTNEIETRTIDDCQSEVEAAEQLEADPTVREVESIEQTETIEVFA